MLVNISLSINNCLCRLLVLPKTMRSKTLKLFPYYLPVGWRKR
jgi:hypothetical protein